MRERKRGRRAHVDEVDDDHDGIVVVQAQPLLQPEAQRDHDRQEQHAAELHDSERLLLGGLLPGLGGVRLLVLVAHRAWRARALGVRLGGLAGFAKRGGVKRRWQMGHWQSEA